ncbi:Anaphase-promoting complex subunit 5 [Nakaseomyces bracarensis]|uniref:Anaphase-promoting complex subunit 5 n=1 Tax=Nakaseomyces bracarensis TaxID=273131 RepID=A0ABR4NVB2_9SACH
MLETCRIKVSYTLTAYDLTILVLIYMYIFEDIKIPLAVFLHLIPDYEDAMEDLLLVQLAPKTDNTVQPVLPFLQDVIKYLEETGHDDIILPLVSHLRDIDGLDLINNLVWVLDKECLIRGGKSSKKLTNTSNHVKKIAKKSVLGVYIRYCFKKYISGGFEDREELWKSFQNYMKLFEYDPIAQNYSTEKERYEFYYLSPSSTSTVVLNTTESKEDAHSINFFKYMITQKNADSTCEIGISPDQLNVYLNWEVTNVYNSKHYGSKEIQSLLGMLSLNDIAKFPGIYFLRYLMAVIDNRYQEALDSIHNYFDYTLTQSSENCFHISLLYLATFHAAFNDCDSAMKAFEEATKIARENKDTTTLNVIMIWVISFIEKHPEYADKFYVTVEQIVRYLKCSPETENTLIFQNAYRFDALLSLFNSVNSITVFEATLKYMFIVLQETTKHTRSTSLFDYCSGMWGNYGQFAISNTYRQLSNEKNDNNFQTSLNGTIEALKDRQYEIVNSFLSSKKVACLSFQHRLDVILLNVQYLISVGEYSSAIKLIEDSLDKYSLYIFNSKWLYLLQLEKARILIDTHTSVRAIPLIEKLLDKAVDNRDSYSASKTVILLVEALRNIGKAQEATQLIQANLGIILQYEDLVDQAVAIVKQIKTLDNRQIATQ